MSSYQISESERDDYDTPLSDDAIEAITFLSIPDSDLDDLDDDTLRRYIQAVGGIEMWTRLYMADEGTVESGRPKESLQVPQPLTESDKQKLKVLLPEMAAIVIRNKTKDGPSTTCTEIQAYLSTFADPVEVSKFYYWIAEGLATEMAMLLQSDGRRDFKDVVPQIERLDSILRSISLIDEHARRVYYMVENLELPEGVVCESLGMSSEEVRSSLFRTEQFLTRTL